MKAILSALAHSRTSLSTRAARVLGLAAFMLAAAAPVVSAETLMMPKRDARKGVPVVVWGITTQPSATVCTLDFGDSTPVQNCAGADRSYKAYTHTYASQGVFTATLTVGTEVATADVQVFDVALLPGGATGDNNRSLGINMAIQDGLRYLWTTQGNRTTFDTNPQTFWNSGGYSSSETALVVLAFQNHGFSLPSNPAVLPTGIYEKYAVQRGLNFVIASQRTIGLGVTPQGDNPCVGLGADGGVSCTGLYDARADNLGHANYTTAVAILPLAASGALNRTVALADVAGNFSSNYVAGKTYGEILQRLVNALAWGQTDNNAALYRAGGWHYSFNQTNSDGSTIGWVILSFLDAAAAGALVPAWVPARFNGVPTAPGALTGHINTNGTIDYWADGSATSLHAVGPQKNGIGLQGLYWVGETSGPRVDAFTANLNSWWPGASPFGIGGSAWGGPSNHGSGYAMFNNFKGLKLQGITTLPAVNRSTRPWAFLGTGADDDWYADYQDWLVANQSSPNSLFGGQWAGMNFSCCYGGQNINAAIAELILSPVALVLPDAEKFGEFGLSPETNTAIEGGSHTVTAKAESTGGTPVPGATVIFTILTGPNAGLTGTDTTDSNGEATFTYTDGGPVGTVGTDKIRASIGALNSNTVEAIWIPQNSPPVATDNTYPATEDNPVSGNAVTDAVADSDPDAGDTLTATLVTNVASGALVFNADGSFTYTPVLNFCGDVSFTYQVNDGTVDSNIATVTINVACVNDPPVANDNTHTTLEDTPVSGAATSSDVDGGAPTYAQSSPASNGTVVFNADGTYTYSPNANFNGTDSFGFTVSDGNGGTDTGVVTITIISVNDLPVCTAAVPSVSQIWPPNHKLVNVTIGGVTDVEGGVTINVTSIFQDEPTNTQGDGNTPIDGYGVGSSTAQVRAERAGTPKLPGNGRMYHISFEGIDSDGGKCTGVVKVGVPHDQGKGSTVVDGGPIYSSTGQ